MYKTNSNIYLDVEVNFYSKTRNLAARYYGIRSVSVISPFHIFFEVSCPRSGRRKIRDCREHKKLDYFPDLMQIPENQTS